MRNVSKFFNVYNFKQWALFLGIFFLPIDQKINHWFFGLFIGISVLTARYSLIKKINKKTFLLLFLAGGLFFIIKLINLFHTSNFDLSVKEFTRSLPFILYPLATISFALDKDFEHSAFFKKAFYSLTFGCLTSAIICWGNILLSLEKDAPPMYQLFGWKRSGAYLTEIVDVHPPYFGILIVGTILFLSRELFFNKAVQLKSRAAISFSILFLGVFLFNLTARNALFFLILTTLFFIIHQRKLKLLFLLGLVCGIATIVVLKHPSKYYRLKMYHMLDFSGDNKMKDKRLSRLEASYHVFKTQPLIGVGVGRDKEMKIQEYKRMGDTIAVQKRFNSHNQFFEYLSSNGVIGGLSFLIAMIALFGFLIKNKYYFYLLLISNILFSSFTESIFERALGIQYYSMIIGLIFLHHYCNSKTDDVNE